MHTLLLPNNNNKTKANAEALCKKSFFLLWFPHFMTGTNIRWEVDLGGTIRQNGSGLNNTITDGGVVPPTCLLTIVIVQNVRVLSFLGILKILEKPDFQILGYHLMVIGGII